MDHEDVYSDNPVNRSLSIFSTLSLDSVRCSHGSQVGRYTVRGHVKVCGDDSPSKAATQFPELGTKVIKSRSVRKYNRYNQI
jgi:hypothetical protein